MKYYNKIPRTGEKMLVTNRLKKIRWINGVILCLAIEFLFAGETLCQKELEKASVLNKQIIKLYQEGRYLEAIPLRRAWDGPFSTPVPKAC